MKPNNTCFWGMVIFTGFVIAGCNQGAEKAPFNSEKSEFSRLNIRHYSLPIKNLDNLRKINFTPKDFLDSTSKYDLLLKQLYRDTTIPFSVRQLTSQEYISKIGEFKELAFVNQMATCANYDPVISDVESYKQKNNVTPQFVQQFSQPVGLIRWNSTFDPIYQLLGNGTGNVSGLGWATGCLVGDDLLLTACHCFLSENCTSRIPPYLNYQYVDKFRMATCMHVVFNYQYTGSSQKLRGDSMVFPITELLESDSSLDFAIVRLGKVNNISAGQKFGHFILVASTYQNGNDAICIFQHYQGDPKTVGVGYLGSSDDIQLSYPGIDTYGGSSGSPIVNYPSGQLEGIHTFGYCNGDNNVNKGVKIQAIKKFSKYLKD